MNTRPRFGIKFLAVVALLFFSSFMAVPQVQANSGMNATVGIFHNALAPYGHWVNHRTYGQVWYPNHVARDWRPYTQGYWAYTGDYGWLWVSYEPWGWAPFHYGRWAWDNWYGWVWVPGRTWAPAWVFWRSGGGYSAWAPMPPNVVWQAGIGLNISYFNYDRDLRWDSWVAVNDRDFTNRQLHQHIRPTRHNRQVIQVTNYINNVSIVNHTIVNPGVPVKQIENVTHRPIVPVVPVVQDKVGANLLGQHDSSPPIIRLPMAPASHEDTHQDEELARRLDGKRADGTRAEPVNEANLSPTGNQEPSVPGRLANEPATAQAPFTTPGQPDPALTDIANPELPTPTLPKASLIGLGLEPDKQTPLSDATVGAVVPPAEPLGQKTPETPPFTASEPSNPSGQPTPVEGQADPALTNQQPGQALSPLPEEPVPKQEAQQQAPDSQQQAQQQAQQEQQMQQQQLQQDLGQQQGQPMPQQTDPASLPIPTVDSTGASVGQTDPATVNLQRQQQIDQLQEDLARRQAAQKQQELDMQQQAEQRAQQEAQQMQQQEAARQQEQQMQQQQLEMQQQAEQRAQQEAQQMQQQDAARQQEQQLQQQQLEMQQQAEQRAQQEAQQMQQQQEAARQQEQQMQQQQLEMQQQAEQRAQQEAQQMQQQEAARQQEQQMQQQQLEMQQQAEQRAQQEAQQMQQQEAARQQEQQMQQQQLEMQQQAQQRAQQEAQQMQQQEAARQQEQPKQAQ
ncbi:MAG: hypothetical protein NTV43_12080 [Methylococcales bacterium]|nr:hypothetical protein [Methylococcales bacterium]